MYLFEVRRFGLDVRNAFLQSSLMLFMVNIQPWETVVCVNDYRMSECWDQNKIYEKIVISVYWSFRISSETKEEKSENSRIRDFSPINLFPHRMIFPCLISSVEKISN